MVCYMVVFPDPRVNQNYIVENNRRGFWVKFGDGEFRDAYKTHNPSCCGVENNHHRGNDRFTPQVKGQKMSPLRSFQLGKALEYTYFLWQHTDAAGNEWHKVIESERMTLETLRQRLARAMDNFTRISWSHDMTSQNPTLVDARRFAEDMEEIEEQAIRRQ